MTRRQMVGGTVGKVVMASSCIPLSATASTERMCTLQIFCRAYNAARFRIITVGKAGFVAASMIGRSRDADLLYVSDDLAAQVGSLVDFLGMAAYTYRTPWDLHSVASGMADLIANGFEEPTQDGRKSDASSPMFIVVGAPQNVEEWRTVAIAAMACRLSRGPVVTCVAPYGAYSADHSYERLARVTSEYFWSFASETVARSEGLPTPGEAEWVRYADFLAGVSAGIAKGTLDPTRLIADVEMYWRKRKQPIVELAWRWA